MLINSQPLNSFSRLKPSGARSNVSTPESTGTPTDSVSRGRQGEAPVPSRLTLVALGAGGGAAASLALSMLGSSEISGMLVLGSAALGAVSGLTTHSFATERAKTWGPDASGTLFGSAFSGAVAGGVGGLLANATGAPLAGLAAAGAATGFLTMLTSSNDSGLGGH